jgi:hypothetical protein
VRVLERHPEGVEQLPGYVWLDTPGKMLHVEVSRLEFRADHRRDRPQLMQHRWTDQEALCRTVGHRWVG